MKFKVAILSVVIALCACGSSGTITEGRENMGPQMVADWQNFRFEADWAQPLVTTSMTRIANAGMLPAGSTASRINLIGNTNYLQISGDSVEAYLPYYGEQQMSAAYNNSDNGIQFKGLARNMEITRKEGQAGYQIKFKIKEVTELFQVNVAVFSNKKCIVNIRSSHRHPIRYDGNLVNRENNSAYR